MKTMKTMKTIALAAFATLGALAGDASAFCGFYINGAGSEMFNDATQVVLMRKGTRTVLSMQNNYKGPPDAFAMVIPVPTVLKEDDVKTLPKDVFDRVDKMGAPRLVEYWEQDPCAPSYGYGRGRGAMPAPKMAARESRGAKAADLGVTIEAQFTVGEYQIVILSAKDSAGLDTWLRQEKYQIPKGAEPLLKPYVTAGMKWFVAKVDPKKVQFVDGRVALSPLRFHYDHDEFTLPIRLGLANSSGTQDLIVSILAPNQRYEVANYKNVTIPTNIDVRDSVRTRFGEFYASLFDATVAKNPGAVVTEYAWAASTCDPCPGPTLNWNDFGTLGADVIDGGSPAPSTQPGPGKPIRPTPRPRGPGMDFVLTRLHARYGKSITEDLVFKAADPIVGGREVRDDKGRLEKRAQPSSFNNFQGRYAIRHWWTGPVACKNPIRGRWGGPPNDEMAGSRATAAQNTAFVSRNRGRLPRFVVRDIPEIGVKAYRKPKVAPKVEKGP
jgi:hypothetical protein